jgi:hypothetical protein
LPGGFLVVCAGEAVASRSSIAGCSGPLQVHRSISAPSVVLAPDTSRHSPDCTPVMVPLELTFHCWLVPPLQGQICTLVPGVVPWPKWWNPRSHREFGAPGKIVNANA